MKKLTDEKKAKDVKKAPTKKAAPATEKKAAKPTQNKAEKSEKAKKESVKAASKPLAKKTEAKAPEKKSTAKNAEKKPVARTAAKTVEKKSAVKPEAKAKSKKTKEEFDDNIKLSDTVAVTEGAATRNGRFDIRRAKDGRFFFNLYASNHAVIAYSQMYSSTQSTLTGIKSVMANAESAPIEDTTLKKAVTLPFPKWEIYIDRAGEYRFRLYSVNGNCICHSHGYSTKATCKGGIESIIRFSNEPDIKKTYKK